MGNFVKEKKDCNLCFSITVLFLTGHFIDTNFVQTDTSPIPGESNIYHCLQISALPVFALVEYKKHNTEKNILPHNDLENEIGYLL